MRLIARVAHWVVYAIAVTGVRSLVYLVSLVGIFMVLWPALF